MASLPLNPTLSQILGHDPCDGGQCLSMHEQLVRLVFLFNVVAGSSTVDTLEADTKQYRSLGWPELLQYIITFFPSNVTDVLTETNLKCLRCYSDRRLQEMLVHLMGHAVLLLVAHMEEA